MFFLDILGLQQGPQRFSCSCVFPEKWANLVLRHSDMYGNLVTFSFHFVLMFRVCFGDFPCWKIEWLTIRSLNYKLSDSFSIIGVFQKHRRMNCWRFILIFRWLIWTATIWRLESGMPLALSDSTSAEIYENSELIIQAGLVDLTIQ